MFSRFYWATVRESMPTPNCWSVLRIAMSMQKCRYMRPSNRVLRMPRWFSRQILWTSLWGWIFWCIVWIQMQLPEVRSRPRGLSRDRERIWVVNEKNGALSITSEKKFLIRVESSSAVTAPPSSLLSFACWKQCRWFFRKSYANLAFSKYDASKSGTKRESVESSCLCCINIWSPILAQSHIVTSTLIWMSRSKWADCTNDTFPFSVLDNQNLHEDPNKATTNKTIHSHIS